MIKLAQGFIAYTVSHIIYFNSLSNIDNIFNYKNFIYKEKFLVFH